MSSPDIEKPKPVQDAKEPDLASIARARKKNATAPGGTLLTGPSGIDNAAANLGTPTLLGG